MRNIILKFGSLIGLLIGGTILISLATIDPYNPEIKNLEIIGYGSMLLAFLLLIPALIKLNAIRVNSWGKNFLYALAMVGIACIIYSLIWTIYAHSKPGFLDDFASLMQKGLEGSNLSAAELAKQKEQYVKFMELYKNPIFCFGITLIEPLPVGFLLSLIAATITHFKFKNSNN